MTSLSRIIRSVYSKQQEEQPFEIQLRDIFTEQFDPNEGEQSEPSIEQLFEEKNKQLEDERNQLLFEREEFERYRIQQLEELNQLKQLWEEEKIVLEKKAYDDGFSQGYEEGIQKANADMSAALQIANETIENSKINARKYIEDQEQVILEIALTAAERIVGTSLERDNDLFISVVKRGLKEAREMKEIKLYVSPTYHGLITKSRDELAELFPTDVPFYIFVNEDMNETDCYIETNHGRIVVSIDEQLHELRLKLGEILDSKD
ncbi:flagellar assembly protein FliH [Ureibacillus sp. MALMAid1270]|uniref:flagellar assembly protein FliH n=1 Tax=Ureibacillus sp. MALMAid1270 TaxID=3411629 RepID=UPI003BA59F2C